MHIMFAMAAVLAAVLIAGVLIARSLRSRTDAGWHRALRQAGLENRRRSRRRLP